MNIKKKKKKKKKENKAKQYLIKKVAFTERIVPTYVHLWFIYYYASSNEGTSQITQ